MKLINQLHQLSTLNISDVIKTKIQECLVEPFEGDVDCTEEFWLETKTFLVLIEDGDVDGSPDDVSESVASLIQDAVDNPEFVFLIDDDNSPYLLAVMIVSNDGGGCYVLTRNNDSMWAQLLNRHELILK
ncbi:hypothetical protein A9Q98_03210 [Thalassotalea sp. 42_200_T64]|nr:hypothetical protein A9Q98_03210 [Thalassotalea sp. 42_200_T64]